MRTLLLPLACTLLFDGVGRAEFDAGPVKSKATQSAFDGMASRRPAQKLNYFIVDFTEIGNLTVVLAPYAAKPGARVKVIHRPANVPSQPHIVNPTGYYWDGATMTK